MSDLGRPLIVMGGLILVLGVVLTFAPRLPGDVVVRRGNFTLVAPIATMILLSLILTIVLNVVARLRH